MTIRNEIAWDKKEDNPTMLVSGVPLKSRRMYHPTERCLFFMLGEQGFNNNADNYWEGFDVVRLYLEAERNKMGWNNKIIADFFGFHPRMADHWFSQSQWSMPKRDQYERMQSEAKGQAFTKSYNELKKEHDQLKKDFYETRAYFDNTHDNMTEVWQFERVTGDERHGHATPKPIEMMNRIIKSSSPDNALMIEPFLGSGSTMVAAHQLGRKCYGMELDPKYCQVIVDRMHKLDPSLQIKRNGQPYEPND